MITGVKGMNDVRPGATEPFLDSALWQYLFTVAGEVLGGYGYQPVWLPVVEDTALFQRGIGEDTDIVSKEMYTFSDRGERQLTLRPEGTASSARAYVEHNLGRGEAVQRWWYAGPMFRAERPQKGRYRQFYQIGAELFGVADAAADAEVLLMLRRLWDRLGLEDVALRLNTLGDAPSRAAYREALLAFLSSRQDALCESCRGRLHKNPLRVLDCKRESCRAVVQEAPDILASLTPEARAQFDRLEALLAANGLSYVRDPKLVRGLDYYTGVIFEFTTGALGAQDAIVGGGRYDNLVADLGGPATPAVGFAAGVERLALLVSQRMQLAAGPHLYVIPMGADCVARAFALADGVRQTSSWRVEVDLGGGRVKQGMRRANKLGARAVLVLGADELQSGRGKLKDLRVSSETEVVLEAAALHAALATICA
jgi:histidyl-tRNA synthetase